MEEVVCVCVTFYFLDREDELRSSQLTGETSEITVICTASAAAFLSFTFGVVTGGAMHYCIYISARKKKDPFI